MEGYQVNVSSSQPDDVTLRRLSKEEIKRITIVVGTQIKSGYNLRPRVVVLNYNKLGGLFTKDKIPKPKVQPTPPVIEEKNSVTKTSPI